MCYLNMIFLDLHSVKSFDIVCIDETVLLCVQEYYGHLFSCHYNCFSIIHHGIIRAVHVGAIKDHRTLRARKYIPSFSGALLHADWKSACATYHPII